MLLFICLSAAFFASSYFGQKAVRAQRQLAGLRQKIQSKGNQESEISKKLKETQQREKAWAKKYASTVKRIDPVEKTPQQTEKMLTSAEADPRIITHGNRNFKKVAITIDDGWHADPRILNLMESSNVKCTVFVIGGRDVGETHPEWIKRMDNLGFEVCTHTYSHFMVTGLTKEQLEEDTKKGQKVLTKLTNKIYPYIRTCGGVYTPEALDVFDDLNYRLVLWDVELKDTSSNASLDNQVQHVLANVQNGSIILCHFGGYNTYEGLNLLIPELRARGYEITTVSEIIKDN